LPTIEHYCRRRRYDHGRRLTEGVRTAQQRVQVDYTDLLWLPYRLRLRPQRYKHVLVDEAQDLSAAQLALALDARARGGRMLFCGDPHQSIYGWIGADPEAYEHIKTVTQATELPLSICYRCPSSHIALAQTLVPTIEAHAAAPAGTITLLDDSALLDAVRPGDLVICRKTAPLVAWCIRLIAHKIPARVRGREIGQELTGLARKLAQLVPWRRLPEAIAAYEEIEVAQLLREDVDVEHIIAVQDRCAALLVCFRSFGVRSVDALCDEIDQLFADTGDVVALSTIHRAKGLEAERVFVLEANTLPLRWKRQRPDQHQQELNLLYVALTRAKQDLVLLLAPDTTAWNAVWATAFRAAGVGGEEPLPRPRGEQRIVPTRLREGTVDG
jgi:superfamily I DNA/RNA helicase